ncbi:MAG TPA: transposase [Chloroflexota bacterium]|nr:transposase [Chloroflexota bacterium]
MYHKAAPLQIRQIHMTDLTDSQWALIDPLLPQSRGSGRRQRISLRLIVNACLYLLRTGCQWRLLPKEYPKWQSVYYHFAKWRRDHTWADILPGVALDIVAVPKGKSWHSFRVTSRKCPNSANSSKYHGVIELVQSTRYTNSSSCVPSWNTASNRFITLHWSSASGVSIPVRCSGSSHEYHCKNRARLSGSKSPLDLRMRARYSL